jgi:hypothetical protein
MEIMKQRKPFGPDRELKGEWRKLNNEKLQNFYSSVLLG